MVKNYNHRQPCMIHIRTYVHLDYSSEFLAHMPSYNRDSKHARKMEKAGTLTGVPLAPRFPPEPGTRPLAGSRDK